MNLYKKTFNDLKRKKQGALVAFTVIGDPNYNASLQIIKKIIDSGVDILELGLPFSDPIADGKTIQAADMRALKAGINTDKAFSIIKEVRKYNLKIPIGLLVYGNMIYQRGISKFYSDAKKSGVDSVLVADVPIEESNECIRAAKNSKIDTVFIVSPLTSNNRIKEIVNKTTGFVYAVSRLGVTGVRATLQDSTLELIRRIRKYTKKPLCVGFGISKPEHVRAVIKAGSDGAIVGSAVVDLIEKNASNKNTMLGKIENYIKSLKKET